MIYANRKKTQNSKPKQTHTKTKSKSKPKCKFKNCLRVCSHCACNTAPNCSDYFTSWPPDYHHHLDAVCWSLLEGVTMKAWAPRKRSGHAAPGDFLNLSSKIKMELKKCEWNSRKRGGGCARRWVECISPHSSWIRCWTVVLVSLGSVFVRLHTRCTCALRVCYSMFARLPTSRHRN